MCREQEHEQEKQDPEKIAMTKMQALLNESASDIQDRLKWLENYKNKLAAQKTSSHTTNSSMPTRRL